MDVRTMQASAGYGALPMTMPMPDMQPVPETGAAAPMAQAAEDFIATLRAAEAQSTAAVTGGGDPHALVTALAEAQLAVEATVAIRDKVVEAYQELLRMPV